MKKTSLLLIALFISIVSNGQNGTHITPTGLFGINTAAPANRLEIMSATGDPYFGTTNGSSGLRFTNLTNANTPLGNASGKILSVDGNGNLILVQDQTAPLGSGLQNAQNGLSVLAPNLVEFGGPLGSASLAQLINDREIPMNGKKILFSGIGNNGNDQIIIGTNPAYKGKFNVVANELTSVSPALSYASSIENRYAGGDCGAGYFIAQPNKASGTNFGIVSVASNALFNVGISVLANNAQQGGSCIGGKFEVDDPNNTSGGSTGVSASVGGGVGSNIGIAGTARSLVGTNYGGTYEAWSKFPNQGGIGIKAVVDYTASGPAGTAACIAGSFISPRNGVPAFPPQVNYAIRAEAPSQSSFPAWVNSYAICAVGDVTISGAAYVSSGSWSGSDKRFKESIKKLDNVVEGIKKLNGYTYNFKANEFKDKNFDKGEHIGLIAQELQLVFPQLVKSDGEGYLSVSYEGMIPVLLEVAKEQQARLENQQIQIDELRSMLQTSNNSVVSNKAPRNTTLTNASIEEKQTIILNQNVPNPFAESTEISYIIPEIFSTAKIIFSTTDGRVIKTINITETGEGILTIYADDLTNGAYNYSLLIDNKIVASKKMIKEK